MIMNYFIYLIFSFNLLYFSAVITQKDTSNHCNTIEQKPGLCIELEDCPYLFNLSQQKPLAPKDTFYLALSQCGNDGSSVCCDVRVDGLIFTESTTLPIDTIGERGIVTAVQCDTPEGNKGQCITLETCPTLLKLVQIRPFTPKNQERLRQSGCGFDGIIAKVCCPLDVQPILRINIDTTQIATVEDDYVPEGPVTSDLLPDTRTCGFSGSNRIVGGEKAELAEFPWMALVEYDTPRGKRFNCGGSLINSRYVLTAAHCVRGKDLPATWKVVSVRLGEYDINSDKDCQTDRLLNSTFCSDPPLDIAVVEQITHELYTPYNLSQHHDIALLRLGNEVTFTEFVKPICLPTLNLLNNQYTGVSMTVAGWGGTGSSPVSNVLLKLDITVKSFRDCSYVYGNRINLGLNQVCAGGDREKDTCKGDSGGPLMLVDEKSGANFYVAGIVSFGPDPCGRELWPGIYTKTTHYLTWIVSKLKA